MNFLQSFPSLFTFGQAGDPEGWGKFLLSPPAAFTSMKCPLPSPPYLPGQSPKPPLTPNFPPTPLDSLAFFPNLGGGDEVGGRKFEIESLSYHKIPMPFHLHRGWKFLAKYQTKTKNKNLFSWQGYVREWLVCCLPPEKGCTPSQPRSLRSRAPPLLWPGNSSYSHSGSLGECVF